MTAPAAPIDVSEWISTIPSLGLVADAWRGLRSVDDRGLDDAIGLLSDDAMLLEPVLGWCRATAGRSGERITTAHRAVIMVGVPAVRSGVLAISSVAALNSMLPEESPIDTDGFWTHAVTVATLCETLAHAAGMSDPDGSAALAGLLHDVGKLGLAWSDPEAFRAAMDEAESGMSGTAASLRSRFGTDHHTIGKQIVERWALGPTIRDAVWHHGQPSGAIPTSSNTALPALVSLAKTRARAMHLGWSGEFVPADRRAADAGVSAGGLSERAIKQAERDLHETVRQRGRAIGIGRGTGDPVAWSVSAAMRRSAELASRLRDLTAGADQDRAVLGAVELFHESTPVGSTPETVVGGIGRSACLLTGVGRVAVVWQEHSAAPWRLGLIDSDGRTERDREVASPPPDARIRRPADLGESHARQLLIACDLDWLARLIEHLREAGTPMLIGAGVVGEGLSGEDREGASCLVLAPVPRVTLDIEALGAIRDLWGFALDAASRSHAAGSLQEELAEANRALTETRDELAAKQSMVRLGQMAAGAAHELNNPLTVIRGRAQMISERAATPKQRDDALAIAEAAQQVSDMVTSLHLLSIPPKMRVRACCPTLTVRDAVDRARARVPESGARSRVRLNTDGLPGTMFLDAELVAQALCEPIANALLAIPGGEVSISAECEAFTDRLKIRVIDRGPGLSDDAQMHAFDPFFSDLPAGRRAGLGLARARSLVDLMNGRIDLGNNPGDIGGAYAEISIPQGEQARRVWTEEDA
ncbi:MAG: HDOD domain-containing protein [Planctomycetota bacterium]